MLLLGYSGFAMVREPGVQHGEEHHWCITGTYIQNKLDIQRRIWLLKLFTDIHRTTLKNYTVSNFIGRRCHIENQMQTQESLLCLRKIDFDSFAILDINLISLDMESFESVDFVKRS